MKPIAENQFIGEYDDIVPHEVCDELIKIHKETGLETDLSKIEVSTILCKTIGRVSGGINTDTKDSTDLFIASEFIHNAKMIPEEHNHIIDASLEYYKYLSRSVQKYIKSLRFEDDAAVMTMSVPYALRIVGGLLVQHYLPNQGFKQWHCERNFRGTMNREFVFMTYLNDVPNGGTLFYHQDKCIEAKKGKTVIWPAHFTHVHKGQITDQHEKYICTGWLGYPPADTRTWMEEVEMESLQKT